VGFEIGGINNVGKVAVSVILNYAGTIENHGYEIRQRCIAIRCALIGYMRCWRRRVGLKPASTSNRALAFGGRMRGQLGNRSKNSVQRY
jgi:hypothetical protein